MATSRPATPPPGEPTLGLAEAEAIAPFGCWEWDITRNAVRWSAGLYRIYGLRPEQFPATYEGYIARVHPEDRVRVHNTVQQAYREQGRFEFVERVVRPSGEVRWLISRGHVSCDARGQPLRMTGVCHDITGFKEVEADLAARARQLERSNEDLDQFAQTAVQHLQEPLRAVESYVQQLADPGAKVQEWSRIIGESVLQMQEFVAALLAYSRAGQAFVPSEAVDLRLPFEDAQASLGRQIRESGAVLSHDPLPMVPADRTQLERVFEHLLGNAIQCRGEAPPRIHVGAARAEDYWVLSVRDNGKGIDPAQLERVFTLFGRRDAARQAPGTGMGLAICRKIVARHGGRIWAVSDGVAKGATFCFTLPDSPPG